MEFHKERLRKTFRNLANELESEENMVSMNSVRTSNEAAEKSASKSFVHYVPDVIDFIRRCDTKKQADEIIAYLEKRGEIQKEYADKLRGQLKKKGVRSFGSKKEDNYYLKQGEV